MDGPPLVSEHTEASASLPGQQGAADAYRPRYEVVAGQILELIRELAMRPGGRLPTEKDLALRLGSSRTVVRDAVKILSASGRVVREARSLQRQASVIGSHRLGGRAAAAEATSVHPDNTLEDYRREIQRRVFG